MMTVVEAGVLSLFDWAKTHILYTAMLLTIFATISLIAYGNIHGCTNCTGVELAIP